MGESRLVPFLPAQQVNLPVCSPHCSLNAECQAGKLHVNTNFEVTGLTRLGIKPESSLQLLRPAYGTTRPPELLHTECPSKIIATLKIAKYKDSTEKQAELQSRKTEKVLVEPNTIGQMLQKLWCFIRMCEAYFNSGFFKKGKEASDRVSQFPWLSLATLSQVKCCQESAKMQCNNF